MKAYRANPPANHRKTVSRRPKLMARDSLAEAALPPEEETRFATCAAILCSKRRPFYELGEALETLESLRLFRGRFETFEACAARYGFKKSHAYRLMASARAARVLSPIGDKVPMPRAESQIRPLTLLSAAQAVQAWKEAWARANAAGRQVTAAIVRRVVEERWPDLAAPPKSVRKGKRVLLRGFNSASAALRIFRADPASNPDALALLEETVSVLREALKNEPGSP